MMGLFEKKGDSKFQVGPFLVYPSEYFWGVINLSVNQPKMEDYCNFDRKETSGPGSTHFFREGTATAVSHRA